jgi:DNA-directed RNA polymerase omega subunit
MEEKKLEKWLNDIDSRHRAVIVVSKRAKQIQKGLRPYFDSKTTKVTTMALEEFVKGKVDWYELSPEELELIQKQIVAAKESVTTEPSKPAERRHEPVVANTDGKDKVAEDVEISKTSKDIED